MEHARADRLDFIDRVLVQWLADPAVTIACGRWGEGAALAELVPHGRAYLLPARYDAPFDGVREVRLEGADHHLHLDIDRVERLRYVIAPSVCLGFRPSFELRLVAGRRDRPDDERWLVALMLSAPYREDRLDAAAVGGFFARIAQEARQRPDLVDLTVAPAVRASPQAADILALLHAAGSPVDGSGAAPTPVPPPGEDPWSAAIGALAPATRHAPAIPRADDPACMPLFERALALPDASLVLYRDRLLIEFQTLRLGPPLRQAFQGHVSWQVGDTRDHHCHLSLADIDRVLFSAEPVSCQGGGLNYTVWFLTAGPCGNPWRADGYCSVVLNRPYDGDRPRLAVIEPVFALYQAFRDQPWVQADDGFLQALAGGPPPRGGPAQPLCVPDSDGQIRR